MSRSHTPQLIACGACCRFRQACLKNGELLDGIANSRLQGNREFGVASTPSFLIGDRKIDGYLPWLEFDALLADAVG